MYCHIEYGLKMTSYSSVLRLVLPFGHDNTSLNTDEYGVSFSPYSVAFHPVLPKKSHEMKKEDIALTESDV